MLKSKNRNKNFTKGSKKTPPRKEAEKKRKKEEEDNRITELEKELEKTRKELAGDLRNLREKKRK